MGVLGSFVSEYQACDRNHYQQDGREGGDRIKRDRRPRLSASSSTNETTVPFNNFHIATNSLA
jgi:hypothetical protein